MTVTLAALVASHCHIAIHDVALAFYEKVLSSFRRDSFFHGMQLEDSDSFWV